jgi:hypothetical protein
MTGRLTLHSGEPVAAALLEFDGQCAKLALPDGFYSHLQQWDGQLVTLSGRAFKQPTFDESDGQLTLWYSELDRKLPLGMCDQGLGIYVDSMKSASGEMWPSSR